MPASELLVNQIKELQRADAGAKEQWGAYCEMHGGGIRDPSKHEAEFCQAFLDAFHRGEKFQSANTDLAMLMKEGQRKSVHFKTAWSAYCANYGGGKNDPMKHDAAYMVSFLDFLGQRGTMGLGMMTPMGMGGGGPPGYGDIYGKGYGGGGPPMKRARAGPANTGDARKDELVEKVKAFQRSGQANKEMWWAHADAVLGGIRDPAKHDSATLDQFLSSAGFV
eukprot:gnl/TRDRNA2_/TRDRNA2_185753_c0_seq1.p1 gnl/TRDRNA2_/TRDRNA2_185753_c0~~gnl/TRDRNA2_/TRDRNA2_185753_c0_seq1.p1  ORF type:complete len:222 (-),score=35.11 gnl/TRDRNA2_/TRDRNA2_185753_c0_seq1:76-741(-)